MTRQTPPLHEIRYHSRSRVLEVSFADGSRFELPAASLYAGDAVAADVGIARIVPLANGAVCLHFDDGCESVPLSWAELYRRGASPDGASR